jgi:uncharacterized protein DUF6496
MLMPRLGKRSMKKAASKTAQKGRNKIHKVMEEFKEGSLKSGGSGKKVTDRKQAVAIALIEARGAGAKAPARGAGSKGDKRGS